MFFGVFVYHFENTISIFVTICFNVSQAFDIAWHIDIMSKIEAKLTYFSYETIYMIDQSFIINKWGEFEFRVQHSIADNVPKGNIMGRIRYFLQTLLKIQFFSA